jgi:exopolyphosphatase/guanosine-5'-triphosphate,3'-diphosphate pyrophosphatase
VIAGREEARLIYSGWRIRCRPRAESTGVDIGGGSTEFIIGKGLEPLLTESLYMGCVSYSLAYFPDGKVEKSAHEESRARRAPGAGRHGARYRELGWQEAVGSSGTARALEPSCARTALPRKASRSRAWSG